MLRIIVSRYYPIVLTILIMVSGTLGFALILRPSLEVFRVSRDNAASAAAQEAQMTGQLKNSRTRIEQGTMGSPAEIEKLTRMFVAGPELAYVLTSLEKHATATRFLLSSLEVGGGETSRASGGASGAGDGGPLHRIPVQIQLKGGGYGELKEFLRRITRSVPLYELTSFTFDPKSAVVSINANVLAIQESASTPTPLDITLFEDPRFTALQAPSSLPAVASIGKENPFVAITPAETPL